MSNARPKTRAEELGIKPKQMRQRAHKAISKIDTLLIGIAGQFGDIDGSICNEVDELRDALAAFRRSIDEGIAYLNEVREELP